MGSGRRLEPGEGVEESRLTNVGETDDANACHGEQSVTGPESSPAGPLTGFSGEVPPMGLATGEQTLSRIR
jgi:hypothetical protein